jgi:hypothetical protein
LGGDDAHTHLVKGLDYQLLRAQREKSSMEDENLDSYDFSVLVVVLLWGCLFSKFVLFVFSLLLA